MSEEREIVNVEPAGGPHAHSAPLPGSTDEPTAPVTNVERVAGVVEPSANPLGDALAEYLERRVGRGSPDVESAFQAYRDRRAANAAGLAAYMAGEGEFPLAGIPAERRRP